MCSITPWEVQHPLFLTTQKYNHEISESILVNRTLTLGLCNPSMVRLHVSLYDVGLPRKLFAREGSERIVIRVASSKLCALTFSSLAILLHVDDARKDVTIATVQWLRSASAAKIKEQQTSPAHFMNFPASIFHMHTAHQNGRRGRENPCSRWRRLPTRSRVRLEVARVEDTAAQKQTRLLCREGLFRSQADGKLNF